MGRSIIVWLNLVSLVIKLSCAKSITFTFVWRFFFLVYFFRFVGALFFFASRLLVCLQSNYIKYINSHLVRVCLCVCVFVRVCETIENRYIRERGIL